MRMYKNSADWASKINFNSRRISRLREPHLSTLAFSAARRNLAKDIGCKSAF
jgi:hypothetical protein